MFLRFDANNDGFIDQEELASVYGEISALFQMEVPDVKTLFAACDTNGDGKIDYTEFVSAAVNKSVLVSQENLKAAFNLIDADASGQISKEELKAFFGGEGADAQGEEIWDSIMAEVDDDDDGMMSYIEFEAVMKSVLDKRSTMFC